MATTTVPFRDVLRLGSKGTQPVAVKRGLYRAGFKEGWDSLGEDAIADEILGGIAVGNLETFQRYHGLPIDGVYNEDDHKVLRGSFDAYARQLYERVPPPPPEQKIREAIVAAGFFWYEHRAPIAYSQYRPFQRGKPPWVPSRWDCSAFVTCCHEAGGAPDPNGRGYDGLGYTGTLMGRGRRVGSWRDLEPGDLVFYGSSVGQPGFAPGDPTHVALYVGLRDGNPMVLSNGSYPISLRHVTYRTVNHCRAYQVAPET